MKSQKWRSRGGLSVGRGRGEYRGKGAGNKKCKWQAQNRQGELKNSIGDREAKELTCMTHRHKLRGGILVGVGVQGGGEVRGEKNGTTVIV